MYMMDHAGPSHRMQLAFWSPQPLLAHCFFHYIRQVDVAVMVVTALLMVSLLVLVRTILITMLVSHCCIQLVELTDWASQQRLYTTWIC